MVALPTNVESSEPPGSTFRDLRGSHLIKLSTQEIDDKLPDDSAFDPDAVHGEPAVPDCEQGRSLRPWDARWREY